MTHEETVGLARRIALQEIGVDEVDWDAMSPEDRQLILVLTIYECEGIRASEREARQRGPQRRAYKLLRSFLTAEQLRELHARRYFTVVGSLGGRYRLRPSCGHAARVEKHGSRWFERQRFCLHDPDKVMPSADVTLGQMLLLLADEPGFLALANKSPVNSLLWDGGWLRSLHAARRARANAVQVQEAA